MCTPTAKDGDADSEIMSALREGKLLLRFPRTPIDESNKRFCEKCTRYGSKATTTNEICHLCKDCVDLCIRVHECRIEDQEKRLEMLETHFGANNDKLIHDLKYRVENTKRSYENNVEIAIDHLEELEDIERGIKAISSESECILL